MEQILQMGKVKSGVFKIDTYYFTVYVDIVETPKNITERYNYLIKKYKIKDAEPLPLSLGFVLTDKFKAHLVVCERDLCYDLISHECCHLMFKVLNFNNIYIGEDNETHALLAGYINSNVYNIILKKECKIQTTYPKILPVKQL